MSLYQLYVFDLDGTLYRGSEPIPGAAQTVQELQDRGALVRYFTNNSSKRRDQFVEVLTTMGFPATVHQVMTSASVTAKYLGDDVATAYVVGEEGIRHELDEVGIQLVDAEECDAVVSGIDRSFTFDKMNGALQHLLKPGVKFIATNGDLTYPVENGGLIPGAGSILASLEACSGRKAFVCGKPNPLGLQQLLAETGVHPSQCLVIGDRYDTDIVVGQRAGCSVHLVLSGVTSEPIQGISTSVDVCSLV